MIEVRADVAYLLITPYAGYPAGYVLLPAQGDALVAQSAENDGASLLRFPYEDIEEGGDIFAEALNEGILTEQLVAAVRYSQRVAARGGDVSGAAAAVLSAYQSLPGESGGVIQTANARIDESQALPATIGAFVTSRATPSPVQLVVRLLDVTPGNYVEVEYLMQFQSVTSDYTTDVTYDTVAAIRFDGAAPAVDSSTYAVNPAASKSWAQAAGAPTRQSAHKLSGKATVFVDPALWGVDPITVTLSVTYAGNSAEVNDGTTNGSYVRLTELRSGVVTQTYYTLTPLA